MVESKKKGLGALLEYVWDTELQSLSRVRRFCVRMLRVFHIVGRGFRENDWTLHSSALTFSTLMAIVPVLALSLAFARGFGNVEVARERVHGMVAEWTSGFRPLSNEDVMTTGTVARIVPSAVKNTPEESKTDLAESIDSLVDRAFLKVEKLKFKAIGGIGLVILVLMVIDVLGRVEYAFNKMWRVTKSRTVFRKFTDYLSVVMVLPVLMLAASSLPIVSHAARFYHENVADSLKLWVGAAVLSHMAMLVMATTVFTFLIIFMPNTKVRFTPGLVGGLITAVLFIAWLWVCAALQIGVANYGKIYGSFAVIPILLAWVYMSWVIVLFGAEVAFAVQNCSTYRMVYGARRASVQAKIILALSVVLEAAKGMTGTGGAFDAAAYAARKRLPMRFLNEVTGELVSAGFLAEVTGGRVGFVLLRTPDSIRVSDVINVIMQHGAGPGDLGLTTMDAALEPVVKQAFEETDRSLSRTTVQDLL